MVTQKFVSHATDTYIESITHLFVKRLCKRCGVNCTLVPSTKIKVYLSFEKDESELTMGVEEGYSLTVAKLTTEPGTNTQFERIHNLYENTICTNTQFVRKQNLYEYTICTNTQFDKIHFVTFFHSVNW